MKLIFRRSNISAGISFFLLTCLGRGFGTSIIPTPWEELVTTADFIGVVECQVAGGIVAKYKVVESWKGKPEANETISIRIRVGFWVPRFPTTLCGERFIVTAYKTSHQSAGLVMADDGNLPLWWRHVPADYRLPLLQGRISLGENTSSFFDSDYENIAAFKNAVLELVRLQSRDDSEELLLRAHCEKYIFKSRDHLLSGFGSAKQEPLEGPLLSLKAKIDDSDSAEEIVELLLTAVEQGEISGKGPYQTLRRGGGRATLQILEKRADDRFKYVASYIRARLDPEDGPNQTQWPKVKKPSTEKLEWLQTELAKDRRFPGIGQAFRTLTAHSPESLSQHLRLWVNPQGEFNAWEEGEFIAWEEGYALGSYFGWKCGSERKKHFQTLMQAEDDYIRVAGAVYLSFEDSALGMRHLEQLQNLEGDAGVWAALNLARRGRKNAMPRALQVFDSKGPWTVDGAHHRDLQNRVLVLLSNSCKASGIQMPDVAIGHRPGEGLHLWNVSEVLSPPEARRKNLDWWTANQDQIVLHDPWLDILKEQKID